MATPMSSRALRIARNLRMALRSAVAQARGVRPCLGCGPLDLERPWELEFVQTASDLDILYCFRLILGRLPGKPEWPGHRGLVGGDLTEVVRSYLSSKEFADRQLLQPNTDGEHIWVDLDGYGMYVPPLDGEVGKHILGTRTYEPNVSAVVHSLLRPGMTFVDIGANIGYFALMAAHLVNETGNVTAFEPNPNNARFIYASALANHFANLRVCPFAACESESLLGYNAMGTNGVISQLSCDGDTFAASNVVYGARLDNALRDFDRVDVIKIDVEGAEYLALKGARGILQQHRPVILSEFAPYALMAVSGVSGEAYLQYLQGDHGYHVSVITATGDLVDCAGDGGRVMEYFSQQSTDHIDLIAMPC